MEPVFVPEGDGVFVATPWASGPWDPRAAHGGAPAALLARAVEAYGPELAPELLRLTVDLLRPVPIGEPLHLRVELLRPGHKVTLIGATLHHRDREVVRAVGLRLRRDALEVPDEGRGHDDRLEPEPVAAEPIAMDLHGDGRDWFGAAMELRSVSGRFEVDGPAGIWFRLVHPIVPDEEPTSFMRVAAAADFANGISRFLEWGRYLFINPDLTVALTRPPRGEWVGLDARSWAQPTGAGQSEAALYDLDGRIGRSIQTLLVDELAPGGPPRDL